MSTVPAPTHDIRKAWQFIVDSYDGAYQSNYSPTRGEWTDEEIWDFVKEHHVVGIDAFKL